MTPLGSPGRCGLESIPRDDVLIFLVSPVVTLLQCNTKDDDAIQDHRGRSVVHAHGTSRAPPVLRFGSVTNRRSFFNVHDSMITKILDLIRLGRLRVAQPRPSRVAGSRRLAEAPR